MNKDVAKYAAAYAAGTILGAVGTGLAIKKIAKRVPMLPSIVRDKSDLLPAEVHEALK